MSKKSNLRKKRNFSRNLGVTKKSASFDNLSEAIELQKTCFCSVQGSEAVFGGSRIAKLPIIKGPKEKMKQYTKKLKLPIFISNFLKH